MGPVASGLRVSDPWSAAAIIPYVDEGVITCLSVQGLGFGVQGLGFRVWGEEFRV